jgi:pimeloyl-ACP methyl ester carboxylesterase
MHSEKVTFPGAYGDALAGRLENPDGEARGCALFAHCFTCGKDVRAASTISRALAREGVRVLRFDFTGLGSSEGDFANTTFSSNVGDLVAAAQFLEREREPARLLVGHSLGGAAVLAAAAELPAVRAVATIGAPFEAAHVRGLLADDAATIERDGEAVVAIAGRAFRIRREFLEDLRDANSREVIARLGRPLMVMHSPADTIVPLDEARRIFEAARHPKSFVSLDDADHLLSRRDDAVYVARVLSAWASRYV